MKAILKLTRDYKTGATKVDLVGDNLNTDTDVQRHFDSLKKEAVDGAKVVYVAVEQLGEAIG